MPRSWATGRPRIVMAAGRVSTSVLLGLTDQLFEVDLVLVRTRYDAQLRAEVLVLRHQLRVLERKVGKPAWQPGDRILASTSAVSRCAAQSAPATTRLRRWQTTD